MDVRCGMRKVLEKPGFRRVPLYASSTYTVPASYRVVVMITGEY